MSTYIILQARTGSSRLPNKMLKPFYQECGILEILLERIRAAFPDDFENLIVATTTSRGDDRIEALCRRIGIKCFRGSESDVLSRFVEAAHIYHADKIIRICADNVFLDVDLLKELYNRLTDSDYDYVSYCTSEGLPSIKTHYGFWAEGAKVSALEKVMNETSESIYHEHVTIYLYTHPEEYSINLKPISETIEDIESYPNLRLTIDTIDDFQISQEVYAYLISNHIPITSQNILEYPKKRPELFERMQTIINQNIK